MNEHDRIDFFTITRDWDQVEQISIPYLQMLINKIGFTYRSLTVRDDGDLYNEILAIINKRFPKQHYTTQAQDDAFYADAYKGN